VPVILARNRCPAYETLQPATSLAVDSIQLIVRLDFGVCIQALGAQ
jgi:hypothetical protein